MVTASEASPVPLWFCRFRNEQFPPALRGMQNKVHCITEYYTKCQETQGPTPIR